jgi:HAD superfamily hydrolase (TIGR01490 family)
MKVGLAIYDMDRTVTRRPTYVPFLLYTAVRIAPWRLVLLPAALLLTLAYALGLIDRARLKELNYTLLVGRGVAPERLRPVTEAFAQHQLRTNVLPQARAAIEADRNAGRRLVLATASYELYAGAIGRALGFDDVIATRTLTDARGRVVARIDGLNCYGAAKRDMVEAWLESEGLARDAVHIRFYSDHHSDTPMHRLADEAVAANPDARLARLAAAEGWEVVRWHGRRRRTARQVPPK